jgi:RHS repeat-associated protein
VTLAGETTTFPVALGERVGGSERRGGRVRGRVRVEPRRERRASWFWRAPRRPVRRAPGAPLRGMILRARRSATRAAERVRAHVAPRLEPRPVERAARRKHASGIFCLRARDRAQRIEPQARGPPREIEVVQPENASDSRFTGKEEDVEVGLQYFGKRFYAPLLQRWISPDPLTIHGLGADPNVYAYVSGRALKSIDPLGLDPLPENIDSAPPAAGQTTADASYLQGFLEQTGVLHAQPQVADCGNCTELFGPEAGWLKQNEPEPLRTAASGAERDKAAAQGVAKTGLDAARTTVAAWAVPFGPSAWAGAYVLDQALSELTPSRPSHPTLASDYDRNASGSGAVVAALTLKLPPLRGPGGAGVAGGELSGPYIHGINKGGLPNIIAEQRLLATEASAIAGGQAGVRAYTHSLDKLKSKPSTDFVEFFTRQAPSSANPGQSSVLWSMEAGKALDVTVTRIAHPDGTLTIFPQAW